MIGSSDDLLTAARFIYGDDLPRQLHLLGVLPRLRAGEDPRSLAREVGTTTKNLTFMGNAVRGDFGNSIFQNRPVIRIIGEQLPSTVELTASAMLVALLMALPVVLFAVVYVLNPEYVMLLFTEPMGKKMLAGAIVLQLMGAIAIRRIIQIKI